jgi:hypothetical protein
MFKINEMNWMQLRLYIEVKRQITVKPEGIIVFLTQPMNFMLWEFLQYFSKLNMEVNIEAMFCYMISSSLISVQLQHSLVHLLNP